MGLHIMELTVAQLIALGLSCTALVLSIIGQAIYLTSRQSAINQIVLDTKENTNKKLIHFGTDIDSIGRKIDTNKEDAFEYFVTKAGCDGINKNWQTFVTGTLKERDINNNHFAEAIEKIGDEIMAARIESKEDHEKIDACLRKIQKNLQCD